MYLLESLVACPSCSCHARPAERVCPHCGAALLREDGTRQRTAGAMLLGLLVAAAAPIAGCGGNVDKGNQSDDGGTGEGSVESEGGTDAGRADTGCVPVITGADYGVAPTTCRDGG